MDTNRITLLESFLKEDPSDAFSKYALALEYEKTGNADHAIALLEELKADQPDYLALYYQLGKLYEKKILPENVINCYHSGVDLAKRLNNKHTLAELKFALSELTDDDDDF